MKSVLNSCDGDVTDINSCFRTCDQNGFTPSMTQTLAGQSLTLMFTTTNTPSLTLTSQIY